MLEFIFKNVKNRVKKLVIDLNTTDEKDKITKKELEDFLAHYTMELKEK